MYPCEARHNAGNAKRRTSCDDAMMPRVASVAFLLPTALAVVCLMPIMRCTADEVTRKTACKSDHSESDPKRKWYTYLASFLLHFFFNS